MKKRRGMSILKKLSIGIGSFIVLLLLVIIAVFFGVKKIENSKNVLNDQIKLMKYVFELKNQEKMRHTKNFVFVIL